MSLLLEALKKAERAKEEAQRRARDADAGAAGAEAERKPVVTRDKLPDISPTLEIASEDLGPAPARAASAVAAAAPAPEPKPAAKKPAADAEVLEAVNAWAKAWSAKDVDGYLAAYARDFQPPKGESREDWAKGRRQRIGAPKSIAVTIESPKVSVSGDGQASVSFRQGYRSDVIKSSSRKTLVLVKSEGRWLIQQEKVN